MKLDSPLDQHMGPSESRGSSLAGVPPCTAECRLVRVTGVLAVWDAQTCVALVLASRDRLSSTRAPPSPAAYGRQPQHPPPWPTQLKEPAARGSQTVTSGKVGSWPGRTDRLCAARSCAGGVGGRLQIIRFWASVAGRRRACRAASLALPQGPRPAAAARIWPPGRTAGRTGRHRGCVIWPGGEQMQVRSGSRCKRGPQRRDAL